MAETTLREELRALQAELATARAHNDRVTAEKDNLVNAIRKHRDQRGDDRCWLDDEELYTVLGEPQPNTRLVPKEQFLSNCSRFWEHRQNPNQPYETEADRTNLLRLLLQRSIEVAEKWHASWSESDGPKALQMRVEAADSTFDIRMKARDFLPEGTENG
jgi:hypothetical protein